MAAIALALLLVTAAASVNNAAGPVEKVLQLLTDLEVKVKKEGATSQKNHEEFTAWCLERSSTLGNEITTGSAEVEDLKAAIERAASSIEAENTKIEDATTSIATNEADLKAAIEVRQAEMKHFDAEEQESLEIISALERAIGILEKELHNGGAAMLQCQKANSVIQAIGVMVESSMLGSQDARTLMALVQEQGSGSPDGAAYENHSGSILDTLGDLLEKARSQLDEARNKEKAATSNFEKLKQSLEDAIKYAGDDLAAAKRNLGDAKQDKVVATEDLAVTSKNLAENKKALATLERDCETEAQDFEAETKSRAEELEALAEAQRVIADMTGGAKELTYSGSASFLQLATSGLKTRTDLANFEVVQFVRKLARQQHSEALTQLGRRVASAIRAGSLAGDNPFKKVKGLISDLIARLQAEADEDAAHKAYCDKETAWNNDKKQRKEGEHKKLTTQIDTMEARSAKLKEQVAALQKALADLAATQKEMNQLRETEHKQYLEDKAAMEKGIEGIKLALKVLRDYYAEKDAAHDKAEGGASGIIGLLEVTEADFTKALSEIVAAEKSAQQEYDQGTKDNEIETREKEQDVKYKTSEIGQLVKALQEARSDHKSVSAQLAAIVEYENKLIEMCAPKVETYAARKAKREAEIAGLTEALSILENEAGQ